MVCEAAVRVGLFPARPADPPPSPRVYTLPAGVAFADALAHALIGEVAGDPLALADITVLVPTRRAVRTLADAFLRAVPTDGALVLPRLVPLGDIDADPLMLAADEGPVLADLLDLPPPMAPLARQAHLARQILDDAKMATPPASALALAGDLGRLIDQVHTHRLGFERLVDLVPDELAEHWQITLDFLKLVTRHWPEILAAEGREDPARHRVRVMEAQTGAWAADPPATPVIAAGSTGSLPATADLLALVARLPRGAVVLPGLDRDLDEASWRALDDGHPQIAMHDLLVHIGCERADVADWPCPAPARRRGRLIGEVMRPAETSDRWRALGADGSGPGIEADAIADLTRIDAADSREEGQIIALLMRDVLNTPGRTAALITPDRALARRVAAEMRRWGVEVDDSGGSRLAETPVGTFLALLATVATEGFSPVGLLALLKHPLAAAGLAPASLRHQARRLELRMLRGPRPAAGLAGLARAAEDGQDRALIARLTEILGPLETAIAGAPAAPGDLLAVHLAAAEALAATPDRPGAAALWAGEDGEAAAALMAELTDAFAALPAIAGGDYPALFGQAMADSVVRPRFGTHPRLAIWGPLEARLQSADRIILGGLNEGTWPADPAADPWMSRPMRRDFGLPAPERRIGLAAHDFAQALAGPEVFLTRAERVDGTPQMPSRWLLRLDAVLTAAGLTPLLDKATPWRDWAALIDQATAQPIARPAPKPPVQARPDRYRASDIGLLRSNPYAFYARHILKLQPLEALEADPDAAERGELVHAVLAEFLDPAGPGAESADRLLALLEKRLAPLDAGFPAVAALWRPRLHAAALWLVETQRSLEPDRRVLAVETTGKLILDLADGAVTVTARADRIDRDGDGSLVVIDYKTGGIPSQTEVEDGRAPQLAVEGLIAEAGGFVGISGTVGALAYWRVGGGASNTGIAVAGKRPAADLIAEARVGVAELLTRFRAPDMPFLCHPIRVPEHPGDYDHLARVDEWSVGGEA